MNTIILQELLSLNSTAAWSHITKTLNQIMSQPLDLHTAVSDVLKRDRLVGEIDHFLMTSGWDLWQVFGTVVERTADRLLNWWAEPYAAKAVLILDGLSLREMPWLLQGANTRGYTIAQSTITGSELPGDTTPFAQALGFSARTQLQNNQAGFVHKLIPCATESTDISWIDCASLVESTPNWVFWHHWPDALAHGGDGAGQGLDKLTTDVAKHLSSDDFWNFVDRLATGRRLIITSDHGYAASGQFFDAGDAENRYLKTTFKSGRSNTDTTDTGAFIPPVALRLDGRNGSPVMVLGRRKWKSPGGYPTLTHGGLTLLEVFSPFIELIK